MSPTNSEARFTLTELADQAGVTVRTVRYYVGQGLLAVDVSPGPGPKYDDTHLARLRLIKRLQAEHQPLAEIRHQLKSLSDAEVFAFAADPAPTAPSDSAVEYIRRVTTQARGVAERPLLRRSYLSAEAAPTPTNQAASSTPRLERSQWERLTLAPDIELHIRRPLPRSTSKRVDRLVEIARDLLEEDLP